MPKTNKKFSFKTFIPSRLFLIIGVVILVIFSVALGKEVVRKYEVNKEINQLKEEVVNLEKRNAELSDLMQFLNTDRFKEEEARTKLGMAKPGEKVVVIPNVNAEENNEQIDQQTTKQTNLTNPQKWWNYFFNH